MCSVEDHVDLRSGPFAFVIFLEKQKLAAADRTKCIKCNVKKSVIAVRQSVFCKDCFLANGTHRIRQHFGRNSLISRVKRSLLCFSGGPSSRFKRAWFHSCRCLLWMVCGGSRLPEESSERQKRAECLICYLLDGTENYTPESIREYCQAAVGKPVHVSSVCDWFPEFKSLSEAAQTETARLEIIRIGRERAFVEIAKRLNCEAIITGESSTVLATRLIEFTCTGRGFSLPFEAPGCFSSTERNGLVRIQPMADTGRKEISLLCHYLNLENTSLVPSRQPDFDLPPSIQSVTEEFITQLEADFPATVSTVTRTAEKITTAASSALPSCQLCSMPVDLGHAEWLANATTLPYRENSQSSECHLCYCYACTVTLREAKGK